MMAETVMLIDADYADRVAFDLTVNFERMLERRIAKADLPLWLDCAALDGGVRPGDNKIQAIFLHSSRKGTLDNFSPCELEKELAGKAFKDNLGEFAIEAYKIEDTLVGTADMYGESLSVALDSGDVRRLILVADMETYGETVRKRLSGNKDKEVTILAMQPCMGSGFAQVTLGYSLMSAMGIKGEEFTE